MSRTGIKTLRKVVEGLLRALDKNEAVPLNKEFAFYPVFSAELKNIIGSHADLENIKNEGTYLSTEGDSQRKSHILCPYILFYFKSILHLGLR